jgi:hypothetical protein
MPSKSEVEEQLKARLSYVEEFLDTSVPKVVIRAELVNPPEWLIPGGRATIVVPQGQAVSASTAAR